MTDVQSETAAEAAGVESTGSDGDGGPRSRWPTWPARSAIEDREIAKRARVASRRSKPTRVVAARVSIWLRLGELWRARELFVFLVRKEIKVKYKNSVLGFLWSMLNPALTLAVFYVLFTFFLPNGIPNFVIYMFSAMLVWNLYQTGVLTGTSTVVSNSAIVKKVAFPREILALGVGRVRLHVLLVPVHRPAGVHDRLLAPSRLERDLARDPGLGRHHRSSPRPWRSSSRR